MSDQTRLLLAVVLTFVVVFVWSYFFTPKAPNNEKNIQNQNVKELTKESESKVFEEKVKEIGKSIKSQKETKAQNCSDVLVETPLYRAVFCREGGLLKSFELKKYKQSVKPNSPNVKLIGEKALKFGPFGILWNGKKLNHDVKWECDKSLLRLKDGQEGEIIFKTKGGEVNVVRRFIFKADSYSIKEILTLAGNEKGTLSLVLATTPWVEHSTRFNKTHLIYYVQKKLHKEDSLKKLRKGISSDVPVHWCGIDTNYFLISAAPLKGASFGFFGKVEDEGYLAFLTTLLNLTEEKEKRIEFYYYLGPKLESLLKKAPKNLYAAIDYGWFDIIAKPLVKVLNFFYRFVGNYGIAIILLTLVIKIIFWPLSHKSYKSMEKMKKIQPLLKKIKEQYKDDREKMNQELMRLYKTYKINPAGGCLPMLLQIPVFIGLYEALLGATELRHAPFISHIPFTNIIWLADLSAKDPLYISPVVMGITMYLQQKLSPSSGDPMQGKIMLIMPIFLTFLFLNFPSGLVIYFITNNVLSTIQQWWMLRKS